MLAPYKGQPTVPMAERGSVQALAGRRAGARAGNEAVASSPFPGTAFSSPHHNTFFLRGNEPLDLAPAAAGAGRRQDHRGSRPAPQLPWYLTALLVSQPLHFGDYGGMPMKILWALLDIATIIVLGSGLYLWLRRRQAAAPADEALAVVAAGR